MKPYVVLFAAKILRLSLQRSPRPPSRGAQTKGPSSYTVPRAIHQSPLASPAGPVQQAHRVLHAALNTYIARFGRPFIHCTADLIHKIGRPCRVARYKKCFHIDAAIVNEQLENVTFLRHRRRWSIDKHIQSVIGCLQVTLAQLDFREPGQDLKFALADGPCDLKLLKGPIKFAHHVGEEIRIVKPEGPMRLTVKPDGVR